MIFWVPFFYPPHPDTVRLLGPENCPETDQFGLLRAAYLADLTFRALLV